DHLELRQGPRQGPEITFLEEHGEDAILIGFFDQGVVQFALDPHRLEGVQSEENQKPPPACQRRPILILPLLRSAAVVGTEPYRDTVGNEYFSEQAGLGVVVAGVGKKALTHSSGSGRNPRQGPESP